MVSRSRSDSESSSVWSSSGSWVEAQTSSVSTTKLSGLRNCSNTEYRPPRGFEPVCFSSWSPLLQKKLAAAKGQQLWAVRIPAGLSPSQLDGVVIDLPREASDVAHASKPLGSMQVGTTWSNVVDTYNLYACVSSTLKGKGKKTQSNVDSQLIAMASETAATEEENGSIACDQAAASELESLHLLVPARDGQDDGQLVCAPLELSTYLHVCMASPAETTQREQPKPTPNQSEPKKLPQQPWHLLKTNFEPAGSRTTAGAPGSAEASDAKKEKKRKVKGSDEKKAKKTKKE